MVIFLIIMIYMYNTIFPLVWVCEWMNKLSCIYYCLNILSQKKYRLDPVLFIWENPGPDWEGVRQIGAHVCINLENKEKNYWWNWSLFTLAPIMRPTTNHQPAITEPILIFLPKCISIDQMAAFHWWIGMRSEGIVDDLWTAAGLIECNDMTP